MTNHFSRVLRETLGSADKPKRSRAPPNFLAKHNWEETKIRISGIRRNAPPSPPPSASTVPEAEERKMQSQKSILLLPDQTAQKANPRLFSPQTASLPERAALAHRQRHLGLRGCGGGEGESFGCHGKRSSGGIRAFDLVPTFAPKVIFGLPCLGFSVWVSLFGVPFWQPLKIKGFQKVITF